MRAGCRVLCCCSAAVVAVSLNRTFYGGTENHRQRILEWTYSINKKILYTWREKPRERLIKITSSGGIPPYMGSSGSDSRYQATTDCLTVAASDYQVELRIHYCHASIGLFRITAKFRMDH